MTKKDYENLEGFFSEEKLFKMPLFLMTEDFSDKNRMSDPIFKSVGYPSKIFYPNIQKYISAYTKPGAVVLDSCAGSGSSRYSCSTRS